MTTPTPAALRAAEAAIRRMTRDKNEIVRLSPPRIRAELDAHFTGIIADYEKALFAKLTK